MLDAKLCAHVLRDIKRRSRVDLAENARVMARVLAACEACKRSLSATAQAQVAVEAEGADYFCNVTRAVLDDASAGFCQQVLELVRATLAEADVVPEQLCALLLAGGGARSPALQAALAAAIPAKRVLFASNSEEAVARGAALHGAMLPGHARADGAMQRTELGRRKLLPRDLAVEIASGATSVLVHAKSPLPLVRTAHIKKPDAPCVLKLSLLELAPTPEADSRHQVCSLTLREIPEDAQTLMLRLSVEADASLELSCEAAFDDATEKPPCIIGSVRAPPPNAPA